MLSGRRQSARSTSFDGASPIETRVWDGRRRVIGRAIPVIPAMFEFIGLFGCRDRGKPEVSVFGVSRRPPNRVG